ncbi:MAG: hypothetical protein EAX86_13510 [Candidatus Heimdallarchaeota archaeon]|nr:hypothetical protein [Candidatus Heimdallarchaeota archaeon]
MPEVPIPGMAFRARLSKVKGQNVVELIFKGDSMASVDLGERLTDGAILSALKMACTQCDIEHQVSEQMLTKVAEDLYKASGLGAGKALLPPEFELSGESSELDRKLAIIISEMQRMNKRLDKIQEMLEPHSE